MVLVCPVRVFIVSLTMSERATDSEAVIGSLMSRGLHSNKSPTDIWYEGEADEAAILKPLVTSQQVTS
jgi:hypothetical protein